MKATILLLCAVLVAGCDVAAWDAARLAERKQLHVAWSKATGVTNLTFEEWDALRTQHLLPGQAAPPDNSAGVAIGIAAGAAMSSGRR